MAESIGFRYTTFCHINSLKCCKSFCEVRQQRFREFFEMAIGSSDELESAIIIARNLEYIDTELMNESVNKLAELQIMILSFKNNLR